jgi:protein SCO1/2
MSASPPAPQHGTDADPLSGLLASFGACLLVLCLGLVALFIATENGTAYTTETQRRSAVARAPVQVPDFRVFDASGQAQTLKQLLQQDERVWIVDFVYTRCNALCLALGTVYQQLQQQILDQGLQDRVGLLSISFDPENDNPTTLNAYARRMRMQSDVWQLVSLQRPADRRQLLDSFGIMVVPAPLGEFEHNAALHLVTADGQLVQILDLTAGKQALNAAAALSAP